MCRKGCVKVVAWAGSTQQGENQPTAGMAWQQQVCRQAQGTKVGVGVCSIRVWGGVCGGRFQLYTGMAGNNPAGR